MNTNKTVYIIGHRNPDTDSVVSAAAYARLKQIQGRSEYIAVRGGKLSPQTEYIFNRFNVAVPQYISDMIPKVSYYMKRDTSAVLGGTSLWKAIGEMEALKKKVIPVINTDGTYCSLLNYNAFAYNILKILNPETSTLFSTNVRLIMETLNAQQILGFNMEEIFKCVIIVVSDSIETFKETLTLHIPENAVVVTADREDVQEYCIETGVRTLILSSGAMLKKELRVKAEKQRVSVLVSPYRSAETAMLALYSSPASEMADTQVKPVRPNDTLRYIRAILQNSANRTLPVVDESGKLVGTISESDLLEEANTDVILVDHNEITQALEGIENYTIREVIDHHRLGNLNTKEPISFINRPVGATCTIIVSLYKQARVPIPKEIAGILLCGILADTLSLKSATVTAEDKDTAVYLSNITNLDIEKLGNEVLCAGNKIGSRTPSEVILQDMKEYNEAGQVFIVSQIEVESFDETMSHKTEFLNELELERRARDALFCAIMITDVIKLTSIMIISGKSDFLKTLEFPQKGRGAYSLSGIVSRKKQLVPLLTEQIEKLNNG